MALGSDEYGMDWCIFVLEREREPYEDLLTLRGNRAVEMHSLQKIPLLEL